MLIQPETHADVVQNTFEMKTIKYFATCNKLCDTVTLFMTNDSPLVVSIPICAGVETIGKLHVFIAPIENNVTN